MDRSHMKDISRIPEDITLDGIKLKDDPAEDNNQSELLGGSHEIYKTADDKGRFKGYPRI